MNYSIQATPSFNQKVSLTKIVQNQAFTKPNEVPLAQTNHIIWEESGEQQQPHSANKKNDSKAHPRRRIFDKFESRLQRKEKSRQKSRSKSKEGGMLAKSKSNPRFTFQQMPEQQDPDERINEINRQLRLHRQNMANSRASKQITEQHKNPQQEHISWTNIEERLTESQEILKRQEEILVTKIPTFEKKIEQNNQAITEVTRLLRLKLQNEERRTEDLQHMMERNQERVRAREEELSRINSELLLKESQIIRNREINKRHELELQRIKRIEDLQNRNLEIYQRVEKKEQLSQQHDYPVQAEDWQAQGGCWECESPAKLSKLSVNKISTIQYTDSSKHSCSANQTIGELLSPLALIENQYLS